VAACKLACLAAHNTLIDSSEAYSFDNSTDTCAAFGVSLENPTLTLLPITAHYFGMLWTVDGQLMDGCNEKFTLSLFGGCVNATNTQV
jgi:hypothetical protein